MRLVAVPGGPDPSADVLVVVHSDGSVYRSDDGALSWRLVGAVPFEHELSTMQDAVVGADGRLYVAAARPGTEGEWVYRTTEPLVAEVAVAVEAQPVSALGAGAPVTVGAEGGAFPFTVRLQNTTSEPQAIEAWTAAAGPVERSPLLGPVAVTLAPGATLTRTLVQRVPAAAPPGAYTYTVAVGAYPDRVVASASFPMVKTGSGAGGPAVGAEGWAVSGWDDEPADVAPTAGAALSLAVRPNPTRGAAEITLPRAELGEVRLALYDVLGREVATLHEGALGAGAHAFPLDGSALRPGLYVLRAEAGGAVVTRAVTRLR